MERESHQPQLDLTIRHRQNGKLSDRIATSTRKTRHIGQKKLAGQVLFTFAAYNLTRIMNLMQARSEALRGMPA